MSIPTASAAALNRTASRSNPTERAMGDIEKNAKQDRLAVGGPLVLGQQAERNPQSDQCWTL